jgi:imidazolonepropionase-like amidohydrolase
MKETFPTRIIALSNVRIFDGHIIQEPSTVIIHGELIGTPDTVPTQTIDGQGSVLLPGLIDSHIHLTGQEDLEQMVKFGVTTALDMATWPVELLNSLRGRQKMTDIRGCGLAAIAPGSVHSRIPTMPLEALVSDSVSAERFVAAQIAEGADYIKVVADVPGLDQESLNSLVGAAHRRGKLVVAHALTILATSMAQIAGVDFTTHVPIDGVMSDEEVNQMLKDKRISIPTLVMMKGTALRKGAEYSNCIKTVSALHRAGVPVLAGTDANKAQGVPANVEHGIGLHEELELLANCGLSTTEVLRSATCLPAKYFGLTDRGSIEPGRRADLVLIEGNPVEDITATRRIKRVWVAGHEVARTVSS